MLKKSNPITALRTEGERARQKYSEKYSCMQLSKQKYQDTFALEITRSLVLGY